MRSKLTVIICTLLVLLGAVTLTAARESWLHVRIHDDGEDVNVNIPLQVVRAVLPMIEAEGLEHGALQLDHDDLEGIDLEELDLREIFEALRDSPDTDFVTVRSEDELVRVSKEDGYLKVNVEDRRGSERVRVTIPLDVVDALLSGDSDELDLLAALQRLGEYDDGDLVTVESDEGTVRVWIDDDQTGGER